MGHLSWGSLQLSTLGRMDTIRLVSSGTVYAMVIQGTGSIINLILDPLLIFGLFGFPRLEVAGAAVATVAGQIVGGMVGLFLCLTHNPEIQMSLKGMRPDRETIRGMAPLSNSSMSIWLW